MRSGDIFEGFHVKGPLARGGMGELWLAEDDSAGDVVLKTVRSDLLDDDDVQLCFRREIDVTARLDHAHVIHHIAHGTWEGTDVLALEHIPGVSLAELLSRSRLPIGAALRVAHDVTCALAYVHDLVDVNGEPFELVHGDVTPQNILIDTSGSAHLIDFGGVTTRETRGSSDTIVGKPGYLSPEQSRGVNVDSRSDQYTLGIVLWEMLAGRELFDGSAGRANRTIQPISVFVSVPAPVSAAVDRMLASDPAARFPSTQDACDAIAGLRAANDVEADRRWLAARARHRRVPWPRAPAWRCQSTCPMRNYPAASTAKNYPAASTPKKS